MALEHEIDDSSPSEVDEDTLSKHGDVNEGENVENLSDFSDKDAEEEEDEDVDADLSTTDEETKKNPDYAKIQKSKKRKFEKI